MVAPPGGFFTFMKMLSNVIKKSVFVSPNSHNFIVFRESHPLKGSGANKSSVINNLKKTSCASKRDVLELATLQYVMLYQYYTQEFGLQNFASLVCSNLSPLVVHNNAVEITKICRNSWNWKKKMVLTCRLSMGCFIYILDSSNSSSITVWPKVRSWGDSSNDWCISWC